MHRLFCDGKHMTHQELTAEQIEELKKRHIRSFTLRRGHISNAQQKALEDLLPKYEIPYAEQLLDPASVFGREAPLVFEIGCGMGETTAAIAAEHPEINFLGCEVFAAGVGALAKRIEDAGLPNVKIIRHDAVDVIEHMIPDNILAGVHIFFPDPWRKKRHHKRRLVAQPFISKLCRKIAPGGYLHCATDWENYAEQMLEVLSSEPSLRGWKGAGYCPVMGNPLCNRPRTKFQLRGEKLGYGIWDLVYIRN